MKCSNPACSSEKFLVQIERKPISPEQPDRLPVKLTCAHCKKPVKVWITNVQMKEMLKLLVVMKQSINADLKAMLDAIIEVPDERKRGWKERIFGR